MEAIEHLRAIPSLLKLRGRHPAIVVCLDDPAPFEGRREEILGEIRCEECPQSSVDMAPRTVCAD